MAKAYKLFYVVKFYAITQVTYGIKQKIKKSNKTQIVE